MILSPLQIAQYLYAANFRGDKVAFGVAVGLAESSGNTEIVSGVVSDGTRGFGLFQIETENVKGGNWQDPTWQAQKFWQMSSGGWNYGPWCTACAPMPGTIGGKGCGGYGSGAAAQYLAEAYAAAAQVHAAPTPAPSGPPSWPGVDLRVLTPEIHGHGTGVWQARMNALQEAVLVVDANYGPATAAATAHYQRTHGLKQDSIVGKITWSSAFAA